MLAQRVERDIADVVVIPAPRLASFGTVEGEREQAVGTNDVTSGRQDRAVDEAEDREVGTDSHGEEQDHVANVVTGVATSDAHGVKQIGSQIVQSWAGPRGLLVFTCGGKKFHEVRAWHQAPSHLAPAKRSAPTAQS